MSAIKAAEGDLLVFLPGAGEIRRVERALRDSREPALTDCAICPLYGDLGRDAQTAALSPDPRGRRKIILATPIAETSLTIEGVRQVVDSGLRRAPRYEAATGLSRLQLIRISRASAAQRAGRAGRLGPGRASRLWSEHDHDRLEARTRPEILDADLAPLLLELAAWGVPIAPHRPLPLAFLDPPPASHLARAAKLLHQLDALEPVPDSRSGESHSEDPALSYRITETGRAMVRLPVHPRLARMLLAAASPESANANANLAAALSTKLQSERTYRTAVAADLAAILSERDPLAVGPGARPLSIVSRLEGLLAYRRGGAPASEGDANIYRTIDQTARQLRGLLNKGENRDESGAENAPSKRDRNDPYSMPGPFDPGALLAVAYPDRIALARSGQSASGRYRLSSGGGAALPARDDAAGAGRRSGPPASAPGAKGLADVADSPAAAVVLDLAPADSRGSGSHNSSGESTIRMLAPLDLRAIETIFANQLAREPIVAWDASAGRVQSREELRFAALVLASRPFTGADASTDPEGSEYASEAPTESGFSDYATQVRAAFLDGLRDILKRGGTAALAANDTDRESFERLRARVMFLRGREELFAGSIPGLASGSGLPDFSEEHLVARPEDWLGDFIVGHQSFSSFRKSFRLTDAVQARLPYATMTWLDEAAPTHLEVPSGSRIRLEYGEGEVVLAVKLQELFGLRETPQVALGRESVTLHLLSPARRPIQVTRDLAGFWERTYGDVKKELKGRYPKHPWPDDPFDPIEAVATRHTKKRRT